MKALYWMGCVTSLIHPEIGASVIRVLKALNVDFEYLGEKEPCCGDLLFLLGFEKEARECAKKNVELIEETGCEVLLTGCAGCYHAFAKLYPEHGIELPVPVLHLSQFLAKLMDEGKLSFKKELPMKATYHDPCELGRECEVYDEPRRVLKAIPGFELVELPYNREDCTCCGAGGGVYAYIPNLAIESAREKLVKEVVPLGVEALVTACPNCYHAFKLAAEREGANLEVLDIAQVVEKVIT